MKVAVTGSSGFVGSHVVDVLRERGFDVMGLDRVGRPDVRLNLCDVGASTLCEVDAVIHCAAHADISRNWEHGRLYELWRDNMDALLATLRATPATARFVFASTAAVLDGPRSPYVARKMSGEAWVRAFATRHETTWPIVRLTSCVGPRYSHGHVADFARMWRVNGLVHARNRGEVRNPFCHVRDAAEALVEAATGSAVPVTHVADSPWGWRDTVEVMRDLVGHFEVTYEEALEGWIGDPVGLRVPQDWECRYSVREGVKAALKEHL